MNQLVPGARSPRLASLFALLAAACGPVIACSSSEGGDTSSSSSSGGSSGDVSDAGVQGADGGGGQTGQDAGGDAATPGCGRNSTPCGEGGSCEGAPDCASGVCRNGKCGTISPSNGVKDGDETDVDCGGAKAPACVDGKGCGVAADCTSGVCTGGKCQVPSSTDGVKNGDETGVDCGGTTGKGCPAGQGCKSTADCDKLKCDLATNKCLAASSGDGIKNGTETDVDCGGGAPTNAPRCGQGKACAEDGDCSGTVRCDANTKTCNPPTSGDGLKNGSETDVDCGGGAPTNAPKCAGGAACLVVADCVDGECTNNVCVSPTNADGKKNGNESDVDCGSSGAGTPTNAARCDAGKTCANDGDCRSGGCNHKGVCAAARSCTMQSGGTTCGTGDSSRNGNQNEDCCASDLVPVYAAAGNNNFGNAAEFRLDRYQITAGRIRHFLNAVNGDVAGWVQANRANVVDPSQLPVAEDKFLPTGWTQADSADTCTSEGNTYPCNYGALSHVSGFRYNNEPGGNTGYGCYVSTGGYSTRTYWTSAAENAQVGIGEAVMKVSQARADEKSMTCSTYFILAAFCAWDGGRLETFEEYNAAYGGNGTNGRTYPWGSDVASRAIGFADMGSSIVSPITNYGYVPPADAVNGQYSTYNANLSAQQKSDLLTRLLRGNLTWNYYSGMIQDYDAPLSNRATTPIVAESNLNVANDASVAVAPPGRYPNGAGLYGHRDLLGNVMEITATGAGTATRKWTRNGSFETSHFNATTMTGTNYNPFARLTKYGRSGGRCARPISGYPAAPLP